MLKRLELARHYIDIEPIRERPPGSNRHPKIDAWLQQVGSPLGSAWCCAAAHGITVESGEEWRFAKSGRVQTCVDSGQLFPASEAIPGDWIVFYFASLQRFAHIAICEQKRKGRIITLDFNSIPDGATGDQREGYGGFRKNRPITDRISVLRPK